MAAGPDGTGVAVAIARAEEWVRGMQSRNGGWGAFDADNAYHYLNNIPFADHGALLDPPIAPCIFFHSSPSPRFSEKPTHARPPSGTTIDSNESLATEVSAPFAVLAGFFAAVGPALR